VSFVTEEEEIYYGELTDLLFLFQLTFQFLLKIQDVANVT